MRILIVASALVGCFITTVAWAADDIVINNSGIAQQLADATTPPAQHAITLPQGKVPPGWQQGKKRGWDQQRREERKLARERRHQEHNVARERHKQQILERKQQHAQQQAQKHAQKLERARQRLQKHAVQPQ